MRRWSHFFVLFATLGRLLWAHDDGDPSWNGVHITPATQTQFYYPYDGRAPKIAVLLHNHIETANSPPIIISAVRVNGQPIDPGTDLSGGGPLIIAPLDVALPSLAAGGVYDGRFGPAPAVGETKSYHFEFDFSLAPGATPEDADAPAVFTLAQDVQFTNLGDTPTLGGARTFKGVLRVPALPAGATVSNPRVEVATPYSPWLNLPLTAVAGNNGSAFAFAQALPSRNDLYLRYSADGYESQLVALGLLDAPTPPLDLTLTPAVAMDCDYQRATAISTPTGFWRGAASESEGTFVAFPGQAEWPPTSTDTDARALRTASRIVKYRYDGTSLWEYAPGWETWGGDMTADGRYVAYVLNPTAHSFSTPTQNQLVLLDGATGTPLWTKSAVPTDAAVGTKLDSIEVRFSPDAKWIAVGSITTGQVTLVDRATGSFIWTTPAADFGFGEITRLCFSPDSQFLYCGSKDGEVRQLRVSDGSVTWRRLVYDAPQVNGLNLSADGAWLAVGSESTDASVIRTADGLVGWQTTTEAKAALLSYDGRYVVTDLGQVYNTLTGAPRGFSHTTGVAQFTPDGRDFLQVGHDFQLFDLGGKLLHTFAPPALGSGALDDPQWVHVSADGRYVVMLARDMTNPPQTGIVIYERRSALPSSVAPAIAIAPLTQAVTTGSTAILGVAATGTPPLAYRWQRNGVDIPGAQAPELAIPAATAENAATYAVMVSNAAGSTVSPGVTLTVVAEDPANPPRIVNVSVRAEIAATPLTVGFTVGGPGTAGPKRLLIRGLGPALVPFGVSDPLPDPRIALYSGSTETLTNDNWGGAADDMALAAQVGAFALPDPASLDAVMALTSAPGSFTVQLAGADGRTGTGLAEIYDATGTFTSTTPRLTNISARANVSPDTVLIAGFVITGPAAKTVLIRGVGPTLAEFGVTTPVSDPELTLFRGADRLAANDNWYEAPNAVQIATAAAAVGAFALDTTSRDAAILISLPPGAYTAQVGSANAPAGDGLIEVYEVP